MIQLSRGIALEVLPFQQVQGVGKLADPGTTLRGDVNDWLISYTAIQRKVKYQMWKLTLFLYERVDDFLIKLHMRLPAEG